MTRRVLGLGMIALALCATPRPGSAELDPRAIASGTSTPAEAR